MSARASPLNLCELPSHFGPGALGFALDLTANRIVMTADATRDYPSECLLALEDVSGGFPAIRGAEIVATTVLEFGAGDVDVSADRPAFNFGDVRVETGDWIEGRLPGMVWPSADGLPKAMGEAGR